MAPYYITRTRARTQAKWESNPTNRIAGPLLHAENRYHGIQMSSDASPELASGASPFPVESAAFLLDRLRRLPPAVFRKEGAPGGLVHALEKAVGHGDGHPSVLDEAPGIEFGHPQNQLRLCALPLLPRHRVHPFAPEEEPGTHGRGNAGIGPQSNQGGHLEGVRQKGHRLYGGPGGLRLVQWLHHHDLVRAAVNGDGPDVSVHACAGAAEIPPSRPLAVSGGIYPSQPLPVLRLLSSQAQSVEGAPAPYLVRGRRHGLPVPPGGNQHAGDDAMLFGGR